MAKLTKKQQRFCDEYLLDCNATQAAIRAGYSKKTANEQGAKLIADKRISDRINEELDKIHTEKMADTREVMEHLTAVMRGECKEQVLRLVGNGVQEIVEIDAPTSDRIRAAELIGKHYGMFNKNVVLDLSPVVIVNDLKE